MGSLYKTVHYAEGEYGVDGGVGGKVGCTDADKGKIIQVISNMAPTTGQWEIFGMRAQTKGYFNWYNL